MRIDPNLLNPVRHRGAEAQAHLAVIRARDVLVRMRTQLVNAAYGLTKSFGERLRKCGTRQVKESLAAELSLKIQAVVTPLLAEVVALNERIAEYDRRIEKIAQEHYPEVARLKQVNGVGTLIALTFVLTVDDPHRFCRSRDVGCYLGLRPRRRNSGKSQPQLHISDARRHRRSRYQKLKSRRSRIRMERQSRQLWPSLCVELHARISAWSRCVGDS